MTCVQPFVTREGAFPCGKCLPCRFRNRRIWFNRLLLEATQHDYSSFVTLTYDPSSEPEGGRLSRRDFTLWLKRLRKRCLHRYPWRKIRYYACGEYGEMSRRPHYHALLFGLPTCTGQLQVGGECFCESCEDVKAAWGLGYVLVAPFNLRTASYVAGYCTRKALVRVGDEFTAMSNRPGIGAGAMWEYASRSLEFGGSFQFDRPIGRYLRKKFDEYTANETPGSQDWERRLFMVRSYAWKNSLSVQSVFRELGVHYESQLAQREAAKPRPVL